jgi:hypothetical protein
VPIANCFVHDELRAELESDALTELWSEESGIRSEQMTINVIAGIRQYGAPYRVMAFLYLPSLWTSEQARDLQTGLASALGRGFGVAPTEIQVITSIVESGQVVEGGETQDW